LGSNQWHLLRKGPPRLPGRPSGRIRDIQ